VTLHVFLPLTIPASDIAVNPHIYLVWKLESGFHVNGRMHKKEIILIVIPDDEIRNVYTVKMLASGVSAHVITDVRFTLKLTQQTWIEWLIQIYGHCFLTQQTGKMIFDPCVG
jgi:hypothetical protein